MGRINLAHKCGDYKHWASLSIAFGLGMCFSCFCPETFVLFIAAVIITALGIVIVKH